jgi:putative isomerase
MKKVNVYSKLSFFLIGILIVSSCSVETITEEKESSKYKNVLDYHQSPDDSKTLLQHGFFDQGAWFGFSFPDSNANKKTSFEGPFLLWENKWLCSSLLNLDVSINNKTLNWDQASISYNSFPGRLEKNTHFDELDITQILVFDNMHQAFIKTKIINKTQKNINAIITCSDSLYSNHLNIKHDSTSYTLELNRGELFKVVTHDNFKFSNNNTPHFNKETVIGKDEEYSFTFSYNYVENTNQLSKLVSPDQKEIDQIFEINTVRWTNWVDKVIETEAEWEQSTAHNRMAVKCLQTLINNWRGPYRQLYHDGLVPSYAVSYFRGFWAWDSWKHAVALSYFDTELAKNQIRAMFDYQDESGMIADCVFPDPEENNYRDTKPPLATWAVWKIFITDSDTAFLKEMYPDLKKYNQWWYKNRDFNNNKILEYGSCDGTRVAAMWESGMDNAARFDSAFMQKIDNSAWTINQESVDLNAYMCYELQLLERIALTIGKDSEASVFKQDFDELKDMLSNIFWDDQRKYFFDKNISDDENIDIYGTEAWTMLWTQLANKKQAHGVKDRIMDTSLFNTFVPLPTLNASHPAFDPVNGYWRGPVWIDQAYFAISGLRQYKFLNEVDILSEKLFNNCEGLIDSDKPIFENYNPLNGDGLNAPHFSWSAAHFLMIYKND